MIWIACVCAVCLGICLPSFMYYKKNLRLPLAAAYKSLGSICAFLLSLIAAIRLDPRCYVCAASMLLYVIADSFLEFNFMFGAGFFLAGHICAVAFFLNIAPFSAIQPICFLLLAALMAFVFWRWRKPIGKQMTLFSVYGCSLVAMTAAAMGCFMMNNLAGILIACGGALFYFSDFLLLRRLLFPSDRSLSWMIMITYYISLLLFGIACLQM